MARIGVIVMAVCLTLYLGVVAYLAIVMFSSGRPIAIAMGSGMIVIALIGAWALIREIQFGLAAGRLGRLLDAEGGMPVADTELTASGHVARADADALVARYTAAAAAAPKDWRASYRLGVVHNAVGRRKAARASIREAIKLSRA